jgi:hypothetical protein
MAAGTALTMIINATVQPPGSTILKLLAGGGLAWYGLKGTTNRHIFAYIAGVDVFLDVFRELSYAQRARALLENVQQRKFFATCVHEWFVTVGRAAFGARAVAWPAQETATGRVALPLAGERQYEVVKLPAGAGHETVRLPVAEQKEEAKKAAPVLVT